MASRRKDGGFPRRKHGNCNKPYRGETRDPEKSGGPSEKEDKPPKHLKGKAMGLWYKARQVKRNIANEEERTPVVTLSKDVIRDIEDILQSFGRVGGTVDNGIDDLPENQFKTDFLKKINGTFEENMQKHLSGVCMKQDPLVDKALLDDFERRGEISSYTEMSLQKQKLPSFVKRKTILEAIEENQIVVISGETGCGKTTQVPQYVFDDAVKKGKGSMCNIVCTQPRRISAISVAERVAQERNENLGESVGYQIRLEKVLPNQSNGILFVTTGILLQWIQSDAVLSKVSHLFIDEVHERDVVCDFLLACLKQIAVKRPSLKIILMSATMNAARFSDYFGEVPCISIPGFTYPVQEVYLDKILDLTKFRYDDGKNKDTGGRYSRGRCPEFQHVILPHVRDLEATGHISKIVAKQLSHEESEKLNVDLIEALIHYISVNEKQGAILVFVPGIAEIQKICRQLQSRQFFNNSRFLIIPLHSTLPTINQKQIFRKPPKGVRKIIVATNIAETSITINDVVFVIDSGFIKMSNFSMSQNVETLQSEWESAANARQRLGRAGRVEAGVCYKLYTLARENLFDRFPAPEIQRKRLDEVILMVKTLQLGKAGPFLDSVMDPPDKKALSLALTKLRMLNALDEDENLTPLGYHLAQLPMDPQIAKMILFATFFCCLDPILSIAAAMSFKDPFVTPMGKESFVRRVKCQFAGDEFSDHLVISEAVRLWEISCQERNSRDFAYDSFLSESTLIMIRNLKYQFVQQLKEMNFLATPNAKDELANVNSENVDLVKAIICAGLYPNVAVIKSIKTPKSGNPILILKTAQHPRVELHPKSIVNKPGKLMSPYFVFHLMLKSSAIFLHDATLASPWALIFFGERLDIVEWDNRQGIRIDDLIKLNCFRKTAILIKKLRQHLDWFLFSAITNPEPVQWETSSRKTTLLKAIVKLITAENGYVGNIGE